MDLDSSAQKRPADYLKILFRRKWFMIIPIVAGMVGGIIAGNIIPKVYQASTLILVEDGKLTNPLIQDLAISTSMGQRLGILREQILGWDRIQQLIQTLNLAKNIKNQWQYPEIAPMNILLKIISLNSNIGIF